MKKMLVTAGNTVVPIDQVRMISNIFRGRTGEGIARAAAEAGWKVTLISSRPDEAPDENDIGIIRHRYRTYDELAQRMELDIIGDGYDVIIHSAAVSDYRLERIHVMGDDGRLEQLDDRRTTTKISSKHDRLFLELAPTLKLVDLIREPWGFTGMLVKFKLQVGITDDELLAIARKSRADSRADIIVANCLEWSRQRAYIVGSDDIAESVTRDDLPAALLRRLS